MRPFIRDFFEPLSFFIYFVVFAWYAWRMSAAARYRVLAGFYLVATCLMLAAAKSLANTHLYNLLYLLSALSLGSYFYAQLQSRSKKNVTLTLMAAVVIYFLLSTLLNWDVYLDSRGHALASLGLVCMVFMYYHQFLNDVRDEAISTNFDFWFVSAQMLYQMGSFAIFLSYNYLTQKIMPEGNYNAENRALLTNLWLVHNVLLFLSALITATSLVWKVYHRKLP